MGFYTNKKQKKPSKLCKWQHRRHIVSRNDLVGASLLRCSGGAGTCHFHEASTKCHLRDLGVHSGVENVYHCD